MLISNGYSSKYDFVASPSYSHSSNKCSASQYFNTSCVTPNLVQCLVFNTYADHPSLGFDISNASLGKALLPVALTNPALTTPLEASSYFWLSCYPPHSSTKARKATRSIKPVYYYVVSQHRGVDTRQAHRNVASRLLRMGRMNIMPNDRNIAHVNIFLSWPSTRSLSALLPPPPSGIQTDKAAIWNSSPATGVLLACDTRRILEE
ncbi:hypothetical protein NP233_g12414 [Leucocoprinus birnbaumii]|uniref:Uncharacterized protein n=1 Tax=Leucocoprinus birnbaumii TaxID=56174 RepID=A0AAD5VEP5_9AGAR|nr:hypothetical protein NP233_g12414 [Leucocoprinus birnbaumii]